MKRDLRDELPPLLRAWWDWTETGLSHWRAVGTVIHLALTRGFLPFMLAALGCLALAVLTVAAVPCYIAQAIAAKAQPRAEIVPFVRKERRG